jgi:hypothetical protein
MFSNISNCSHLAVKGAERPSHFPIYLRGLVMIAVGAVLIPAMRAQAPPGGAAPPSVVRRAGKLTLHQPVERELGPGQTDVFTVHVAAGQFLHVVAEKKGVDVVVLLADPQGTALAAGSANGSVSFDFGPEHVSLIADGGGEYQIQVLRAGSSSEKGLVPNRTDGPSRSPRNVTASAFMRRASSSPQPRGGLAQGREKRLQAVAAYQRAAALWHSLRDDGEVALCLYKIGVYYYALGERQKALDYYNQALPLLQVAGDCAGEAQTLTDIGDIYLDLGEKQKALDYHNQALQTLLAAGESRVRGQEARRHRQSL